MSTKFFKTGCLLFLKWKTHSIFLEWGVSMYLWGTFELVNPKHENRVSSHSLSINFLVSNSWNEDLYKEKGFNNVSAFHNPVLICFKWFMAILLLSTLLFFFIGIPRYFYELDLPKKLALKIPNDIYSLFVKFKIYIAF